MFIRTISRAFSKLEDGGEKGGGLRFFTGCTQEGGGGSFRCVLCATEGVGGLKIRKKCVCN